MRKMVTILAVLLVSFAFVAIDVFAQSEPQTAPPGGPSAVPMQPPVGETAAPPREGDPMTLPRADKIIGLAVMDEARQHIGKVEDLTLGEDGRIEYLVLSRGGVLGIGKKLSAIPWDAADIRFHENALIISLSSEKLESAPVFENWEDLTGSYGEEVRAFYGEKEGSGEVTKKTEAGEETQKKESGEKTQTQ